MQDNSLDMRISNLCLNTIFHTCTLCSLEPLNLGDTPGHTNNPQSCYSVYCDLPKPTATYRAYFHLYTRVMGSSDEKLPLPGHHWWWWNKLPGNLRLRRTWLYQQWQCKFMYSSLSSSFLNVALGLQMGHGWHCAHQVWRRIVGHRAYRIHPWRQKLREFYYERKRVYE
jgi:hypothetical protein